MPAHAARPHGSSGGDSVPSTAPSSAPDGNGVGPTLRGLREVRGQSVGEVSARLKFSTRQIEALEAERWEALPQGVSLRGFVKNYGRFLDADIDALLAMLDTQVGDTAPRAVNVSRAAPLGAVDAPLQVESVSRPWGWLLIILILLAVIGFYALERGWIPDSWLVFDWLKMLKND
ncbi:helix-turn-helix domain-containing protein [Pusillimonas sp. TS35]|nr:helix-turn-helix domain-containing protein [Pusillimonas sp. TS35]